MGPGAGQRIENIGRHGAGRGAEDREHWQTWGRVRRIQRTERIASAGQQLRQKVRQILTACSQSAAPAFIYQAVGGENTTPPSVAVPKAFYCSAVPITQLHFQVGFNATAGLKVLLLLLLPYSMQHKYLTCNGAIQYTYNPYFALHNGCRNSAS